MLSLTDARWTQLEHAYGSASDIPEVLTLAATDFTPGHHDESAWSELWSALCHQGDIYTASYAALPHIVAIARGRAMPGPYDPLMLAGCIELARLEGRGPPIPTCLAGPYHAAVAEARGLAEKALRHAVDEDSQRAFRGSLAALNGDVAGAKAVFDGDLDDEASDGAA